MIENRPGVKRGRAFADQLAVDEQAPGAGVVAGGNALERQLVPAGPRSGASSVMRCRSLPTRLCT